MPGPWKMTVTRADGTSRAIEATPGSSGTVTLPLEEAERRALVSVDVRDRFGNGGTFDVR
jgi:hypothetical protein